MSKFGGFDKPAENYSKLPHALIEQLPVIDSMAELKVVIYLLRHTWGFSEFGKPKRITTDEFMHGRKKKDGQRMDKGTGMSNNSVITGLEKAVEHGFVLVETDDRDKARIDKFYCLNMAISDVQDLHTDPQDLHSGPQDVHSDYAEVAQRSEKETIERNKKKENLEISISQKEKIIRILQSVSFSVFKDPREWEPVKRRLEQPDIVITGENLRDVTDPANPMLITISGLSKLWKRGPFNEATAYESMYKKSYANIGLELTFAE